MAFPAEETPQDKEVAALKRAKLKLETELDSERNEAFKLREQVRELELDVREGNARASQEAAKAVQAEEALRKRTDAYNTLKDQKANAEMALRESEETCKAQQGELKRLNFQLEVNAAHAAAPSKLAEEKAALEKRVHALTTELQRAQMDLEKEKENQSTSAGAPSKIARPASRQSITPADSKAGPTTRSRFGFQSNLPGPAPTSAPKTTRPPSVLGSNASIRSPSSLSNHSAIPKPGAARRASVSADAPAGVPAQKLAQLEADLTSARSSISTLETSLASAETRAADLEASLELTQAKLRSKNDDLLRVENSLMALERSSQDEVTGLRSDLEDARDELEATRDEVQREIAQLAKEAKEERDALEEEIARLTAAAQRRADEREQDDGSREELERLLTEAREDVAHLRVEVQDLEHELAWHEEQLLGLDALKAEKEALAQQLEQLDDDYAECERALEDKDDALDELDVDMATLSSQIATLQAEKGELEARLDEHAVRERSGEDVAVVQPARSESREVEERLAAVETERDELVAALATASRAHQDAETRLAERIAACEQIQVEKTDLRTQLELLEQELIDARSAHNNLRAEATDSTSSLEGLSTQIASLETQIGEKDALIAELSTQVSQLDALSTERDDLAAQLDVLTAQAAEKDGRIEQLCSCIEDLEEFAATTASSAERTSSAKRDLEARLTSVESERDLHASVATAGAEHLTALESALSDLELAQGRIYELEAALDSAHGEVTSLRHALEQRDAELAASPGEDDLSALRSELVAAEEQVATLKLQLRDERDRADAREGAADQVAAIAHQVETLEAAVASERTRAVAAKEDTSAVEEALLDTKAQLTSTEKQLATERSAREAAGLECEALHAQIDELEHSAARLDQVEQELFAVSAELDDVRANAEDASLAALQDIAELQARLREQEAVVDQLERQVVETDALRHILGETEARLDSLGWELRDSQAAAMQSEKATEETVRALLDRAEAAEAAVDQLRAELDEARHRLSDAQDLLDQAQADLVVSTSTIDGPPAPATPTPATPSPATPLNRAFAFSPESDPTVLILRLREERDDLRSRLDFSRTEAKYRVEMLQDRLRVAEESKAAELSTLSLDLMDKQAAYTAECETNAKMEQTLREARREKEVIEERLEDVARRLKDAEGRVEQASRRLAEEQSAREEERAGRESVWALEGALDIANKSADAARAELDAATTANEGLGDALASVQAELAAALFEVDQHKEAAAAAGARIDELEQLNAATQHQRESEQGNALDDFATLCETLRSDVVGLETQISSQSSTIANYERRIALLQLNLAVRVAIEDDDDLVDAFAAEASTSQSAETMPTVDVNQLQQDLAAAIDARAHLEQQLGAAQTQLAAAVEQAVQTSISHQAQLDAATQRASMLETAVATALADAHAAHDRLAEVETSSAAAHDRAMALETQLSAAQQEKEAMLRDVQLLEEKVQQTAQLETAKLAAEAALTVAEDDLRALQSQVAASTDDLAATKEALSQTTASLSALREQSDLAADNAGALKQQVADLKATVERLQVDVDEKEILYGQAQQRAVVLEEQLAASSEELHANTASHAALEASARSAQDDVVSLSARLQDVDQSGQQVAVLEEQLRETRIELATVDALVLQERSVAQTAQAALEQAQAAAEHSAREIQTLRQLNASSQAEAAALTNELSGVRSQVVSLGQAAQDLEARLQQTTEQSRKNLEEVIDALQTCEQGKAVAEEQVQQLLAEVDSLKASHAPPQASAELDARVGELEKLLGDRMADVEEADEKLIEALKVQKRYTAQIERLKAKIATLQRDLTVAKSASIVAAAPLPAAPAPQSLGKKRSAPNEFDAAPVPTPRAIAIPLDKENAEAPSSVRRQARPLSSMPVSKDALVPLKQEHVAAAPRRAALGAIDENAGAAATGDKAAPPPASKVDSLRQKMMRMKSAQAGGVTAA